MSTTAIGRLWKKLQWSLQQRGVGGTLGVLLKRAARLGDKEPPGAPHPFDLAYGVETGGLIGGGDLGVGHPHDPYITAYVGTPPGLFNAVIERWLATPPLETIERYNFVDLGCGKGRVVLLATQFSFQRVIGVELNEQLALIAQQNLDRWSNSGRTSSAASIICADATEFELPPGPCLVYLANPFGEPVLRRLLSKLEARSAGSGSTLEILYQSPHCAQVFDEFPSFELLWSETLPVYGDEEQAHAQEKQQVTERVYARAEVCKAYRERSLTDPFHSKSG